MKQLTLCFLVKKDSVGTISKICLAMKKRGFGEGKWNGVGGKVEEGEGILEGLARETLEEIGVRVRQSNKVGELIFNYINDSRTILVHVFLCEAWKDEPVESEEMNPKWFDVQNIPYEQMWVDDKIWLPLVLERNLIKGQFNFLDYSSIQDYKLEIVKEFSK